MGGSPWTIVILRKFNIDPAHSICNHVINISIMRFIALHCWNLMPCLNCTEQKEKLKTEYSPILLDPKECNNWWSERSECSHSQVIKIEICDRYMFGTCKSYWACAKKVITMVMTFDGQRSSCRSDVESGEDWPVSVLRKR